MREYRAVDDVEQRAWRNTLVIVAAALAMSCSLLAIARVADVAALTAAADALSTSSLGEQSTDEFRLSSAADAAESGAVRADMNCSEYDDDSLYTAIACSEFDASSCQLFCTGNFWCDDLCGDACGVGSGAVCALQVLSNLSSVCAEHRLCEREADLRADDELATPTATIVDGPRCDHHAVCSFCLPNENCAKLVLEGVLQAANMAMVLVADLPTTCAMYSCGAD